MSGTGIPQRGNALGHAKATAPCPVTRSAGRCATGSGHQKTEGVRGEWKIEIIVNARYQCWREQGPADLCAGCLLEIATPSQY